MTIHPYLRSIKEKKTKRSRNKNERKINDQGGKRNLEEDHPVLSQVQAVVLVVLPLYRFKLKFIVFFGK